MSTTSPMSFMVDDARSVRQRAMACNMTDIAARRRGLRRQENELHREPHGEGPEAGFLRTSNGTVRSEPSEKCKVIVISVLESAGATGCMSMR